jgi:hypothetical protein
MALAHDPSYISDKMIDFIQINLPGKLTTFNTEYTTEHSESGEQALVLDAPVEYYTSPRDPEEQVIYPSPGFGLFWVETRVTPELKKQGLAEHVFQGLLTVAGNDTLAVKRNDSLVTVKPAGVIERRLAGTYRAFEEIFREDNNLTISGTRYANQTHIESGVISATAKNSAGHWERELLITFHIAVND